MLEKKNIPDPNFEYRKRFFNKHLGWCSHLNQFYLKANNFLWPKLKIFLFVPQNYFVVTLWQRIYCILRFKSNILFKCDHRAFIDAYTWYSYFYLIFQQKEI